MNKNVWTWNLMSDGVIFLMVVIALIIMFTSKEAAALSSGGWDFLKYFTVLSNILVGVACSISFIHILINREYYPVWLSTLKMVAANGVFVTFMTVAVYLGPLYGYLEMLKGANLFLHLLIPLSAIVEFIFFVPHKNARFITTTFGIVPVFLYGIFYLSNVAINNGYGNVNYDWYQFGHFGLGVGILLFMVMLAFSYGLTCGLFGLNRLIKVPKPLI